MLRKLSLQKYSGSLEYKVGIMFVHIRGKEGIVLLFYFLNM
jgi:hypothetical protein